MYTKIRLPKLILTLFSCVIFSLKDTSIQGKKNSFVYDHMIFKGINDLSIEPATIHTEPIRSKKKWTLMIYMAAVNDLRPFAVHNIKQMADIGSTPYINIIVHLDITVQGNKKITRRYLIEKNRLVQIDKKTSSKPMDSGDEETIVSFCELGIRRFPAENYGLVFWDHGTGHIDPLAHKIRHPSELFVYNPSTNKLVLDRSVEFIQWVTESGQARRGICWDDETGNYLNNQKLERALARATSLIGENFKIVGFDACCMSTLEIANVVKNHADIMVASQEVEMGPGWNYRTTLEPFENNTLSKETFATHIVDMYQKEYETITDDYTLSAIDLSLCKSIEDNVDTLSQLLIHGLNHQSNRTVNNAISKSHNIQTCTYFDEPSYKDMFHFYTNLKNNTDSMFLHNKHATKIFQRKLHSLLSDGIDIIQKAVIANVSGNSLKDAHGLTLYIPRKIHASYFKTNFATSNNWLNFLILHLGQ